MSMLGSWFRFFFFQAEDGIRYLTVTGVQTCALPIWHLPARAGVAHEAVREPRVLAGGLPEPGPRDAVRRAHAQLRSAGRHCTPGHLRQRSEERRVGKECRSRWSAYH